MTSQTLQRVAENSLYAYDREYGKGKNSANIMGLNILSDLQCLSTAQFIVN